MTKKIKIGLDELQDILDFIDRVLDRQFGEISWEEGKRMMNPEIYDLRERLLEQITREVV